MRGDDESAASSLEQEASSNQSNISERCGHPDVRSFGGAKCCLSCGETIASLLVQSSITSSEFSSDEDEDESTTTALDDQTSDIQAEPVSAVAIFQPQGYNEKFVRRKGSYGFSALQLDKKEIRLVILEPGRSNEPVACRIFHTVLGSWNQPRYEAVSYTWGDENGDYSFSRTLQCGREEVPVTRNCEEALKMLRHERQQRKIWIDQLCIDQSDIAERGHQVGLMSEIYASADQVIIYLGQIATFDDELLSYLQGSASEHTYRFRDQTRDLHWHSDILRVISSSWFTRVWVLQEVACARKAFLLISNALVSWDRFKGYIESTHAGLDPSEPFNNLPGPLNFGLRHLAMTHELLDMLVFTNSCNAGDPRDKVFALYGIIMDAAHSGFMADNRKSPEQVFLETARHIIGYDGSLRMLSYAKSGERSTLDLPSWVPDWGTQRGPPLAEVLKSESRKPGSGLPELYTPYFLMRKTPFANTSRLPCRPSITNERQLKLRGLCLDSVTAIGSHNLPMFCVGCHPRYLNILEWATERNYHIFTTITSFGFSMSEVEVGDRVWNFDETRKVFFVSRDSDGYTTLVGECFICAFSYHRCCVDCDRPEVAREESDRPKVPVKDECDVCRIYSDLPETDVILS